MGALNYHRVVPIIRRIDRINGQCLTGRPIDIHAIVLPLVGERGGARSLNREHRTPALLNRLTNRLSRNPRRKIDHHRCRITRHRTDRVAQDHMIGTLIGRADIAYLQRRPGGTAHRGSIVIPLITNRVGTIGGHIKNNKGSRNHRLTLWMLSHCQRRQNQNINRVAVRDPRLV